MMKEHIVTPRVYLGVFGLLMVLTALTVAAAFLDLGYLNTVTAITIAVVKAVLVVLFFMHVRYSSHLTWVFVGASVLWLLILFSLTMSDVATRGWQFVPQGWTESIF